MSTSEQVSQPFDTESDAVTHELRSAFTNLRMAAQLLQRRLEAPTPGPEQLRATSVTLIAQLERMESTLMPTLLNGPRRG